MLNLIKPTIDGTSGRTVDSAVRAEQVRMLYRQLPLALSGSIAVILVVSGVLWDAIEHTFILLWAGMFLLLSCVRLLGLILYRRSDSDRRNYLFWGRMNHLGTTFAGLVTGAIAIFPAINGQYQELGFLAVVFMGLCATSLATNGSSFIAVLAYIVPLLLPTGLWLLLNATLMNMQALGALLLFFIAIFTLTAKRLNRSLLDSLRLRFRNNALYKDMMNANHRARETASQLQVQMAQREQAERHLSAYAKRLQRANAALQREIAERENNEQQLTQQALSILESEARMRAVFENAFDAIITFSAEGIIDSCNDAAQSMFGYGATSFTGQHIGSLLAGYDDIVATRQLVELEGVRADGSRFPVAFSVDEMQLSSDGQYVCVVRDETSTREAKQALIQAKESAEAANKAKSEFLSSMSHELRTPLNAILGFTQLMQSDPDDPLTENHRESVDQISRAGWHLLRLINDILDLAKIESGRMETSVENVSLQDVIQESISLVLPHAEQKNIEVIDHSYTADIVLRADYTRLKQILLNLLSNSIKYNRQDGKVIIQPPTIQTGHCRLIIEDTGMGLTKEQMAVIFSPFTRVAGNKEEIEGTGIGLTITQRLVEMMGGKIGVDSEVGKGSRFWIELPLAASTQVTAAAAHGGRAGWDIERPQGMFRVLYVEDNPANLKLVQSIIARQRPNIELITATNGEDGLEQALESDFDLFMFDISLPGMSGIELLEALQQSADTRRVPAIALSANAMPKDIENGLAAGFACYLTKPIDVAQLLSTLDTLLTPV
jgi:PAS domain S-box-containing protein